MPTVQLMPCNEARLKKKKEGGYLTINYCSLSRLWMLSAGILLQGRLCAQLGHFTPLRVAGNTSTTAGVVLICSRNYFTWPISSHPPGADQGMEKQTGLVTHNQERGPVWLCNAWRIGSLVEGNSDQNRLWQSLDCQFFLFISVKRVCKALPLCFMDCCKTMITTFNSLSEETN